jgi:signal transduction histidine kinase
MTVPDPGERGSPTREELEQELALQHERFEAVVAIGQAIGSITDLDGVLTRVMDHTTRLMRAERSTLYLIDRDRKEIWSKVVQGEGLKEIRLPLGSGIAGWVCVNDQPVLIPDASRDARFNPEVDRTTGFKTRSMVVAPMHDVTGAVCGAIQALNRKGEGSFGPKDQALLEAIAAQAGAAIENARLFRDAQIRNRELSEAKEKLAELVRDLDLLYDIEKRISESASLEQLVDAILEKAMQVLGVEAGSVLLAEDDSGLLYFKSAAGEKGEAVKSFRLPLGQGIAGTVAKTGVPILTNDAARHPAFDGKLSKRVGFAPRAILCVPLAGDGGITGALELIHREKGQLFEAEDLRLATLVAGQIARALSVSRERSEGERKARLATIGQMISGVLHDLRTPMTIISGYTELMISEDDDATRREYAATVLKQLDHISGMARETLAFARGEKDMLVRKVHLNQFLDETEGYLAKEMEGKQIEFKVQRGWQGAVRWDESKIKRALYNIARNAAQAMPEGGRFTLAVDKEDEQVVFRLSDTGVGIPEEIADKMFQSFVTAGKKEGTGLGLAIVKKVVEEHGGDVSFKSKPGKGTTFTLRLPVEPRPRN